MSQDSGSDRRSGFGECERCGDETTVRKASYPSFQYLCDGCIRKLSTGSQQEEGR